MNRWKKNRFARPAINVEDVIDYLYDFFADFKKKLKFNRFDRINMEVPRLIISKFKELFEIWDNNLMVSKSLEKDLFEDVYVSMADVFENYSSDSSDHTWFSCDASSYLECKQCGEEIVLRNNNREYSVAYHNASRQHLEFVENFEKVRNQREPEPVEQAVECIKCDECDEEIAPKDDPEEALALHKKSLLHWEHVNEKKIDDIEFISQVIDEQGVTVKCHLCCVNISIESSNPNSTKNFPIDIINSHTKGENHVLNSYWFGLQSNHIKLHSKEENLIKCTLCDEIFVLNSFQDHFYAGSTSQHGRRMLLASINADNLRKSVGKMKIYYITRLKTNEGVFMKCHLCHVLIRAITTASTDKDIEKYLADAVKMHQETEDHILNLYWFELQNCYVKVHDRKENLIECTLCDEIFRLDLFHNHFYAGSNSQHGRRTLLASLDPSSLKKAIVEMKIDCISQVENNAGTFMRCHICRVLIPRPTVSNNEKSTNKYLVDVVNLHQQEEDHLLNLYWLQLQSHYVEVYDRKQSIIRCTLCDRIFHLDSFYDHFYGGSLTNQHNRRTLLAAIHEKQANKSAINLLLDD